MKQFTINIAGCVIEVNAQHIAMRHLCMRYLCESPKDFTVTITPEDISFEQEMTERERAIEGLPPKKTPVTLLESTALQRKIAEKLFEYDTVLFHGSVISVDGEGFLFTAKSGTGKSTHTRLWRELLGNRAVMVNDDKPFLQVRNDTVQVYGSPWNGKHKLGNNVDVPLKAICILERGDHNEIHRISANEAVPMLLQQSNRPQQIRLLPKYLDLLEKIADKIAFYRLKCNMDPEAAVISYQAMSGCVKEK